MPHAYSQGDEPVPGSGYRLSSFLGRGGFGEVWKATAPGGAEAALKIIHLGGQAGRKEFRALQLVKRIRHPNLVPIIAFWLKGKDGTIIDDAVAGQTYLPADETQPAPLRETMLAPPDLGRPQAAELIIAMGLGDISLFDRLEQCRAERLEGIPRDELLDYMEDVAEAIDFLNSPVHDLGSGPAAIQHCDIKPHNLMIVGGAAQICDFGLARMMGADRTTSAAATIAYAAPECLQTGQPSASTDQYSLAVSYYELRTGGLPYKDETLVAVMAAKQQGNLDFSRLTAAEQAVLRCATLRDPAERFPAAVVMIKALREAAAAAATQVSGEVRPSTPAGRRLVWPLAVLAMLAGATAGGWFLWGGQGDHRLAGTDGVGATNQPSTEPPTKPVTKPPAKTVTRPSSIEQAESFARSGWAALAKKDYATAIANFEKVISLDPHGDLAKQSRKDCAVAYLEQGTAALKKKEYDAAILHFNQASNYDPANALIFVRRARAWDGKGEFAKAVKDLTTAIDIEPNDADYVMLGLGYDKIGEVDKAVANFSEAIRLNPRNAAAFMHRGYAYLTKFDADGKAADLDQAIADLTLAIETCRKHPKANIRVENAFLLRAPCYMLRRQYNLAAADFAELIRLDSKKVKHGLLDGLAEGFAEEGQFAKAIEWETKAIKLAPDDAKDAYRARLKKYRAGK